MVCCLVLLISALIILNLHRGSVLAVLREEHALAVGLPRARRRGAPLLDGPLGGRRVGTGAELPLQLPPYRLNLLQQGDYPRPNKL